MAVVIAFSSSGGDLPRAAYGDGLIARYVAFNLTTAPDQIHPVVVERGTSLRYGRIGLPITIWLAAGGREAGIPWAHAIVIIIAAGAVSAATVALLPRAGPLGPLLPFLAPGLALSIAGGYAEVLALAFALWAVVWAIRDRYVACSILLALALLTRENVGAIALGLFVWLLLRRRVKGAAILALSLLPLFAWYAVVAARFGHIPVLDPYLRTGTDTVMAPVIGPIASLLDPASAGSALLAAVHIALAILAFWLFRTSLLGFLAAFSALQVLISGPFAWRFIGDGSRTAIFVQTFTILALIAHLRHDWVEDPARQERPPAEVAS